MEENRAITINISWQGIVKIIAILAAFYFLYLIRNVLAILFVAFLLSSAIEPAVDWLQRRKFPRVLSAIVLYLAVISLIGLFVYLFVPPIAKEVVEFSKNSPEYISKVTNSLSFLSNYSDNQSSPTLLDEINSLGANWQGAAGKIFSSLVSFFGGILSFILIIVLSFYMIMEDRALNKLILSVVPKANQSYGLSLANRIESGVGRWLRGQLLLSLIVFIIIYIGLLIIGVHYALVLALIAGLAEFIPYLGPLISAIPAILVSFIQAPVLIIAVAILYYLTHWLESHLIVPQVMGRIIGLNPIIIIAVMLIGFRLAGLVGVVLAIPLAMTANVILGDILNARAAK
ncbi:MAG TPA: AI-2E family transporter [Candidatus Nanoarchaeia archaeon]|nr:AI-2E family transporter [Candidatus Nanoarchaeia archaeon]